MLRILIFALLVKWVALSYPVFAQNEDPAGSPVQAPGLEEQKPLPVFDKKKPIAKGIILAFKSFPLTEKQKNKILSKTAPAGLKQGTVFKRFKMMVFEWENWREGKSALDVCDKFSDLDFLDYCEPDLLQGPATGMIRKKGKKKAVKKIRQHQENNQRGTTEPTNGPVLKPVEAFSTEQSGNIKSCEITPSKLGLFKGKLSDYWAQEMIGSDLMKEELKNAPPVKKHLVAVFDTPSGTRHDIAVKNLISDDGRHAVLPKTGNSITTFDSSISSFYSQSANGLLSTAEQKCKSASTRPFKSGGAVQ